MHTAERGMGEREDRGLVLRGEGLTGTILDRELTVEVSGNLSNKLSNSLPSMPYVQTLTMRYALI